MEGRAAGECGVPDAGGDGDAGDAGEAVRAAGGRRGVVADRLTKLADLRDRGVLSDAEFQTQKARLLGES